MKALQIPVIAVSSRSTTEEGYMPEAQMSKDAMKRHLRRLYEAIGVIRFVSAEIPAQNIATFLAIAMNEGVNVATVGQKVGIASSSASRNVSMLSNWDWKKKKGLDLVEYRQDPQNLTTKQLFLTAKGRRLMEQLATTLEVRLERE